MQPQPFNFHKFIERILAEDGPDHTSLACIPDDAIGKARLLIKENGVLAGVEMAEQIFAYLDPDLETTVFIGDGANVEVGNVVLMVNGSEQSILRAERLVLNCMQRMSGIATLTRQYVEAVQGTKAKILDTRKTTPGFRYLEKWAVRLGGGTNHRFGLSDMLMIKDNHHDFCGGITAAIHRAQAYLQTNNLNIPIEIEVRNLRELEEVLSIGQVQRIMFDNFSPEVMREAVERVKGQYETEASAESL